MWAVLISRKLKRPSCENPLVESVKSALSGDRELRRVVQTRFPERAHSMHLDRRHKRIPVRSGTPAGPGMQVDAAQAEGRRNQGRAGEMGAGDDMIRLLAHVERLAIENE